MNEGPPPRGACCWMVRLTKGVANNRCITARRRRRRGYQPYFGTSWAARPGQYGQQNYNQPYYNNSNNPAPPPAYGASNDYYAQRNDVELQSPQPAYQPPKGPPPGHAA